MSETPARGTRIRLVKPELPPFDEIEGEFRAVFESGRMTNFGPHAEALERAFCQRFDVAHAATVANATTGLVILLNVLPKGSEVLVPSFTFLPTVQAILWNGLVPVFVDVDPQRFNIAPERIERHIGERSRAILAVHAFGAPCAIDTLSELAAKHRLRLFFDSAHAAGAQWCGRPLGGFGDAEVFSLSATKLLPCGEGGVVTTNDPELNRAVRDRRNYGFLLDSCRIADRPALGISARLYDCANLGLNGKITEFAAILGVHGLGTLAQRVQRRNQIAARYRAGLSAVPGLRFQRTDGEVLSSYKDFVVVVDPERFGIDRDRLRQRLDADGIETASYFCPAVHQFTLFDGGTGPRREHLTVTETLQSRVLSLPIHSALADADVDRVINSVRACGPAPERHAS